MSDPMAQLVQLQKTIEAELGKIGMREVHVMFMPNPEGGPHVVQIAAQFSDVPDAAVPDEPLEDLVLDGQVIDVDAQFEDIMRGSVKAEEEQKVEDAAAELQAWLDND